MNNAKDIMAGMDYWRIGVFCLCLFALLLFGCADLERNKFWEGDDYGGVVGEDSSSSRQNPGSSAQGSQGSSSSVGGSSSQVQGSQSSSSSVAARTSKGNDINNYRTVEIGTQTWMAENLDYNASGSKCHNNLDSNCDLYGRLYDWATAMALPASCNNSICKSQIQSPHQGICPDGWHIPSETEWDALSSYVQSYSGCVNCDAALLKAKSGWSNNGNGTDEFDFTALPGGYGFSDGRFSSGGYIGDWWSTNESASESWREYAYLRSMNTIDDDAHWYINPKSDLQSVRCIKDSGGNSSSSVPSSSSSVAARAGKGNDINNYETIEIGTQTWMAENLDYNVSDSRCYGDDPAKCDEYGSLYTWAAAMALPASCNDNSCANQIQSPHQGICPDGWHIPTDDDWNNLETTVGTQPGIKLKATSGWNKNDGGGGNGTDSYGFSALPGGYGLSGGSFSGSGVGNSGIWWSVTEYDAREAYTRHMSFNSQYVDGENDYKSWLFSVRCIKD